MSIDSDGSITIFPTSPDYGKFTQLISDRDKGSKPNPITIHKGTPAYKAYFDEYGYCDGMTLCIVTSDDDFASNLRAISTFAEFSGQLDMQNNDLVDIIDYAFMHVSDYDNAAYKRKLPFLWSIDPYDHTFIAPNLIREELDEIIKFAEVKGHEVIVRKSTNIVKYINTVDEIGHHLLLFDGM